MNLLQIIFFYIMKIMKQVSYHIDNDFLRIRLSQRRYQKAELRKPLHNKRIITLDEINANNFRYCGINVGGLVFNIVPFLMLTHDTEITLRLINQLGFIDLRDTIDVFYNILWLYNNYILDIELNNDEIAYLSGLSSEQLILLLSDTSSGFNFNIDFRNKSELLFMLITGSYIEYPKMVTESELVLEPITKLRYDQIKSYSPSAIWVLAEYEYKLSTSCRYKHFTISPYNLIGSMKYKLDEKILSIINPNNIDLLISKYNIIISEDDLKIFAYVYVYGKSIDYNNELIRYHYKLWTLIDQLRSVNKVFDRPSDYPSPPHKYTNDDEMRDIYEHYTTKELVDAYKVPYHGDRLLLINTIIEEATTNYEWFFDHNTKNVTLCYGREYFKLCYSAMELNDRLSTNPNIFPDYNRNMIDPINGNLIDRHLTPFILKQLLYLLKYSLLDNGLLQLDDNESETFYDEYYTTSSAEEKYTPNFSQNDENEILNLIALLEANNIKQQNLTDLNMYNEAVKTNNPKTVDLIKDYILTRKLLQRQVFESQLQPLISHSNLPLTLTPYTQ